jgi:3'-phosphoadenosine 5'-phosphosulfate sulfotransferase (PAPS reductase)/FAD synthetase
MTKIIKATNCILCEAGAESTTTTTRDAAAEHRYQRNPLDLLTVNYGVGLDSTAMLVRMKDEGIRPDMIIFSDTGTELPETYAYLPIMQQWCKRVGFPEITVVRYKPVRATYDSLWRNCLVNETLPSLAFGLHGCSLKFKAEVINKFLKNHPAVKACLAAGGKIQKAIGYDAGPADMRRSAKAKRATAKRLERVEQLRCGGEKIKADLWETAHCTYHYFLQDWGLARTALAEIIRAEGLPVPHKSACWCCPASQPEEVVELKLNHPKLYEKALQIEETARTGRHGLKTKCGLGMGNWKWSALKDCNDPADARRVLRAAGYKVSLKETLRP